MMMKPMHTLATLATLCAISGTAAATPVSDPVGDFLPTYVASGRPTGADLDVVSAEVIYLPGSHQFEFIGTMAGAIGTTHASGGESPLYVWGVDRGQGTQRFLPGTPSVGAGVAFDSVVMLRPDTTALVNLFGLGGGVTNLAAGTATINGNTILGFIDESMLPSLGKSFAEYTWNLWPRFGAGQNAQISDFAPNAVSGGAINAANHPVTVPEPATLALLGIGMLTFVRRRQTRN